jgi:hypothetical protein
MAAACLAIVPALLAPLPPVLLCQQSQRFEGDAEIALCQPSGPSAADRRADAVSSIPNNPRRGRQDGRGRGGKMREETGEPGRTACAPEGRFKRELAAAHDAAR